MTADQAYDLLARIKDRRDYRRACHMRRPADEAAENAAERRALDVLDALRITADAFYSMAGR